jgi:hypothetical protein
MKKYFIHYSVKKLCVAIVTAAVALLASAPAQANTSWVHGGNWADNDDNYQTGVIYPTGITSSTTTTQAAAEADTIALDDMSVGINFVRIGINPATVSDNWSVAQAYINELTADGLYVDLCFWTYTNTVGTVTDESSWQNMWETVDSVYSGNNKIFYEPINEPFGYSSASSLESVYSTFLGFINKSQSYIILDGTGYANDVTVIGGDSSLSGCLLGVHIYPFWHTNLTTVAEWESELQGEVGSYASRTIMTEMGAPATTGLNYDSSSANVDICFIQGVTAQCLAYPMGFVYWPSHRAGDSYRLFNSPGGGVTNPSLIDQLQNGWDFFTDTAALTVCDFSVAGTTDYSTFRPSNSSWEIESGGGGAWGTTGDLAVPADYAGNGKVQMATWRPSNDTWYLDGVSGGGAWGTTGDIPVPADYNGTGKAQLTMFRPSNGNWYVYGGGGGHWGTNGDIPVPGYYNNDGHADLAVYRPSNNTWYIDGGATVKWGTAGDIPVPGDYNGSGTTQIAIFRPSTSTWWIYGGDTVTYGESGDVPVPGDYNGSGTMQIAVWRPSNNTWYVNGVGATAWGATGDVPLPLPYAIRHYSLGYTQ